MSIRLGTTNPSALRLGTTVVAKLMLGVTEVWTPGFDPISLSPSLWLSDTGSDPSVWPDLSGNSRNAAQSDAARQPSIIANGLNGRQVRRFDGSNDSLGGTLSSVSAMSVFAVFVPTLDSTASTSYARVFSQRGSATVNDFDQTGHYIPILRDTLTSSFGSWASTGVRSAQAATTATAEVRSSIHSGTVISNFRNGTAASTYSHNLGSNGSAYYVGGQFQSSPAATTGFLKGDIAEILVYPTALSTANRQAVQNYLGAKWGITVV